MSALQELRYGGRTLLRNPTFSLTLISTLALGIGANIAVFSVLNAVLLRPLPYPNGERVLVIRQTIPPSGAPNLVSARDLLEWRRQAQSFSEMAAVSIGVASVAAAGVVEHVKVGVVGPSFFTILGVGAAEGRGFAADEEQPGKSKVAVLSHAYWLRRYGGDRSALGQSIVLSGTPYTIIGVLPAGFDFNHAQASMWVPRTFDDPGGMDKHNLVACALLRDRVARAQATAEMRAIAGRLERARPATNKGWGVDVISLREELNGNTGNITLLLFAAAGMLLLIACANIAHLLLARSLGRSRELALRTALGATPGRLARLLLAESLLYAAIGGALGILIAWGGVGLIARFGPASLPAAVIDATVLGYALLISTATGILFGLAPARHGMRLEVANTLKDAGARGGTGAAGSSRSRAVLVAAQVGLSLVLVTGALLLVKSLRTVLQTERGYDPHGLLTFQVYLPRQEPVVRTIERYERILNELKAVAGEDAVAASTGVPVDGVRLFSMHYAIEGLTARAGAERPTAMTNLVSPDYLRVLRIPLLRGRAFTERDRENTPAVLIVSESFARRYWPGGDALGKQVVISSPAGRGPVDIPREIVGIAGDVRYPTAPREDLPDVYLPFRQTNWPHLLFFVRLSRHAGSEQVARVRAAVRRVEPDIAPSEPRWVEDELARVNAPSLWNSVLLSTFAAVGLVLALVGVYGVTEYATSRRAREIGVRMAMGAGRGDIVWLMTREAFLISGGGIAAGLLCYLAVARLLASFLYGIRPTDPISLAGAVLALVASVLAASCLPAWRAARVDPARVLRAE
ncbi:MAG: ABC transporter permease [Acidobacteria bacterium]|nr:ABC transporter permease [Acidobacteriota bacterium]